MSERTSYEPNVPCFVATIQPDPRAAADFYGAVFGWTFAGDEILVAQLRGRPVAAITPLPPDVEVAGWITDVAVTSADEAAAAEPCSPGRSRGRPGAWPSSRTRRAG